MVTSLSTQEIYDDLVIRLRRQTHWDDSGQVPKDLRRTAWGDAYVFQAEVRQSPVPLQGGAFRIDIAEHLTAFQHIFANRVTFSRHYYNYADPPQAETRELAAAIHELTGLGDELYKLLPVSFHQELPGLIQHSFAQGHGLRLILEAQAGDQADRLLSLPWELLFLAETRVAAARSPRLLVVRRLLDAIRQNPVTLTAPYQTVHVIAHSAHSPIGTALQAAERQALPQAIGADYYHLVEGAGSVENLLTVLQQQRAQVVHFLGHGEFHHPTAESQAAIPRAYLRFVDEAGQVQWVTGEQFQHLLSGTPGVQLIVLNACHGGSTAANNIALDLVYSGFPYVVAMQGEITQDAARYFIQAFYKALQEGRSLDYAVAAGRFVIYAHLPGAIDWCLPVLYTNIGLAEKAPLRKTISAIEDWFRHPETTHPIAMASFLLGGAHLATGLLLWRQGLTVLLPSANFLAMALGWLVVAPPLIAWWVLHAGQLPIPTDWPASTQRALQVRVLGAASIGIGLPMLYVVWFNLILLVGLDLWSLLPPAGQVLLLGLLAIGALFISYAQALSHGLGFITSAQVGDMPFEWRELLIVAVGYLMLALPLLLLYRWPDFLAPPLSNLLIGTATVGLAYALYRERAR